MAKDAYYFSHDANSTEDMKIKQLISVYDFQGYGWFWRLIELMRSEEDYTIPTNAQRSFNAVADTLKTTPDVAEKFIADCINEFIDRDGNGLFKSDGKCFWSESLTRRMEQKEKTIEQRREAGRKSAEARKKAAEDQQKLTSVEQPLNECSTIKGKERKGNKRKDINTLSGGPDVLEVVSYFNEKVGRAFTVKGKQAEFIAKRLSEGATVDQCKKVIDKKLRQWRGTDQAIYLRPSTLFNGEKFEAYLNEPDSINGQGPTKVRMR